MNKHALANKQQRRVAPRDLHRTVEQLRRDSREQNTFTCGVVVAAAAAGAHTTARS